MAFRYDFNRTKWVFGQAANPFLPETDPHFLRPTHFEPISVDVVEVDFSQNVGPVDRMMFLHDSQAGWWFEPL